MAMRLGDLDALFVSKEWERCTCPAQVIHNAPTIDAVPVTLYEQTLWERDTALYQLNLIGKSLGETMDDVETVVRCEECWKRGRESFCPMCFVEQQYYDDDGWTEVNECLYDNTTDDGFCGCGERRNDG